MFESELLSLGMHPSHTIWIGLDVGWWMQAYADMYVKAKPDGVPGQPGSTRRPGAGRNAAKHYDHDTPCRHTPPTTTSARPRLHTWLLDLSGCTSSGRGGRARARLIDMPNPSCPDRRLRYPNGRKGRGRPPISRE
ncbi:hypothetical protein NL676_038856 [Syzygium grande]|nr:hypothetical protein NL676_038856 [Syzygium grande]